MKLLFGVPTGGAPTQPFLESVTKLELPPQTSAFERHVVRGNYVPAQRELLANRALDLGADILIMCDDDMVLPADALVRLASLLAERPRCALAGALYYSRDGFRPMVVSQWSPENTTAALVPAFDRTPVEVDGVGFGCVAVRMDALRELAPPYFPANVYMEPKAARVRVCNEDYLFCARLRAGGWQVVLEPGVRCGHYDRLSGQTFPLAWEPPELTNQARMAVMRDDRAQLVPAQAAMPGRELHQRADLTYIWPE